MTKTIIKRNNTIIDLDLSFDGFSIGVLKGSFPGFFRWVIFIGPFSIWIREKVDTTKESKEGKE